MIITMVSPILLITSAFVMLSSEEITRLIKLSSTKYGCTPRPECMKPLLKHKSAPQHLICRCIYTFTGPS
ncbi:hypothetical protein KC19_8G044400 [Ceratodon purpureus]|uniref:Secreted protein n=1 Tax=Ceratodon purpureus TaxID=3225 RepID=A0A8T0GV36_CERPU|nr:hypothetical protein KC19_8G044400 [Ceratodon purpureus]